MADSCSEETEGWDHHSRHSSSIFSAACIDPCLGFLVRTMDSLHVWHGDFEEFRSCCCMAVDNLDHHETKEQFGEAVFFAPCQVA